MQWASGIGIIFQLPSLTERTDQTFTRDSPKIKKAAKRAAAFQFHGAQIQVAVVLEALVDDVDGVLGAGQDEAGHEVVVTALFELPPAAATAAAPVATIAPPTTQIHCPPYIYSCALWTPAARPGARAPCCVPAASAVELAAKSPAATTIDPHLRSM